MGTAMGRRPGSALRRVGTPAGAAVDPNMQSVGLSTSVGAVARPLTQGTGIGTANLGRPGTAGPGRQIADKTYFIGLMRTKIGEIDQENARMQAEYERLQTAHLSYAAFETEHTKISKEVHDKEANLADFNLALDKVRTATAPSDLEAMLNELRQINAQERQRVDDVFLRRKEQDQAGSEVDQEIQALQRQAEARMEELGEGLRHEYASLQTQQNQLQLEIADKEQELQQAQYRDEQMQNEIRQDSYRTHLRGVELRKELQVMGQEQNQLLEETDSSLTTEQMKERIINKVKEDNALLQEMERKTKSLEELVENYQDQVAEKQKELEEMQQYTKQAHKYEQLFERDKKMQQFIDSFDESYQQHGENKAKLQHKIKGLMRHVSKFIRASDMVPNRETFKKVQGDLDFKEKQKQAAEETLTNLKQQKTKLEAEFAKIDKLDEKIKGELESLGEKQQRMETEIQSFRTADELKQEHEEEKRRLLRSKHETLKQKEAIKTQVQQASHKLERLKQELKDDSTGRRLENLESKLKTYAQQVFQLQEYIATKKRESDYEGLLSEVKSITSRINNTLIAIQVQREI